MVATISMLRELLAAAVATGLSRIKTPVFPKALVEQRRACSTTDYSVWMKEIFRWCFSISWDDP